MVFATFETSTTNDFDILSDLESPFVTSDEILNLDWLSPPDSPSEASSFDPTSLPASPMPLASLKNIDTVWTEALFPIDSDSDRSPSPTATFEKLFPELIDELSDSDSEPVLDGECSKPMKRKMTARLDDDYDDDEDEDDDDEEHVPSSKRPRTRKSVQPAAVPKPRRDSTRSVTEELTSKAIASLRATSCDSPDSKRRIHNVLERKRRNDLKVNYQELRESIPELETTDRAPTGQILMKAVEYIAFLQDQEKALLAGIAAARQENERLRKAYA